MASTEASARPAALVQPLAELDAGALAALQALVADSGWNQVPEDWALFHAAGSIHVVRDAGGRIVASGAVLPMRQAGPTGARVAWISMILVHSSQRGAGLGRAVFGHCLRQVQADGRVAMLDATPAGEALYHQFGFEPLWRLTRWRREARTGASTPLARQAPAVDAFAALDSQAQGFERSHVLGPLMRRPSSCCLHSAEAMGLVRAGRVARHIGPLLAASEGAAAALLTQAADALEGPLLADVPDQRPQMQAALRAAGFQPQRGFARMALAAPGLALPAGQAAFLHAVAGPEFA